MNKRLLWIAYILALTACGEKSLDTRLQGEIKGLGNDTIYLYGTDGTYNRIDTVIVNEGKFEHMLQIDTITSALLVFDQYHQVPLFLDPQEHITIQGQADALNFLTIKGGVFNEEYTLFQQSINEWAEPSDSLLEAKAEEFIRTHHSSLVSVYLLNTYFVQRLDPNYEKIEQLMEQMTGTLQDNPIIAQIKETIKKVNEVAVGKSAPYFKLPNAKGEMITRIGQFRDKYLLIHFWASWNKPDTTAYAQLRELNKKYKKSKTVGLLGVSFDIDKEEWKRAIKQDTLTWEQVCDFKGLNSGTAQQYAIINLPCNVLIKPDGKIAAWNVTDEELKQFVTPKDAH